jgi:FKBP-type peptidyl-prolyl cis-trans isomerase
MKHCPADFCKRSAASLVLFLAAVTIHAKAIQEEINLGDDKARISYAFGMTVGGDLKQAGLEMDYTAFTEGLKSAMEQGSATLLDKDEALEIVQTAFENAMSKQAAELRIKEENFLIENAQNDGVVSNPSGLQYMVIAKGDGPKPAPDDIVRVHYEGTLIDGTVFDNSYHSETGEEIPLDMVIPGWAEGIQLMNVGSKYKIFIPSSLAYGERGAGQVIPPYSTLIFTIELLEIVKRIDEEEEFDFGMNEK